MTRPLRAALATGAVLLVVLAVRDAGTLLVSMRPVMNPDAVVSLASHEWERLPDAARLAKAAPSATVILTLPQPVSVFNCHDCGGRVSRLQHLGVSPDRITIVPLTTPGTYGEATAVLDFVRKAHIRRLIVVTTPYHTRRALAVFRKVFDGSGIEVGIEPASASPAQPGRWWATPYDRAYVAYEWASLIYYGVRFRVLPW